MTVYAPGSLETDPTKQNMALQEHARQIGSANTSIATNTANISTIQGDYASKTANNSLSGTQTVTNATASTTTGTGAVVVTGGIGAAGRGNFGGNVGAPSITPTAAPGTAWGLDSNACTITVAGSSNAVIADGSGVVILTDGTSTGQTGVYVLGGSATASMVFLGGGSAYVAPSTTPAANKYSMAFNGTHYAIYNGNAGSITFTVAMLRTRVTT